MYRPNDGKGRWGFLPVGDCVGAAPVDIPCGGCICCRINRQGDWSLRMQLEAVCHEYAYFVTLTYAPEYLPAWASLVPKDFSDFMKRLRDRFDTKFPGARIRFSGCGEYGTEGRRPHYHAILYTGDTALPDLTKWRRSGGGPGGAMPGPGVHLRGSGGSPMDYLFRSALVEEAWSKGFVEIGFVTPGRCDYVAGYAVKHLTGAAGKDALFRHNNDTGEQTFVHAEFTRHSVKPGIGAPWFQKFHRDVVSEKGGAFIVQRGGVHRSMPGYFLRLLKRSSKRVADGKEALPGLEGLEGLEDILALTRGEESARRYGEDLRNVGGDRVALASMRKSDCYRVAEFRAHMFSQKREAL